MKFDNFNYNFKLIILDFIYFYFFLSQKKRKLICTVNIEISDVFFLVFLS